MIFVTGGTGLLGNCVVRELAARNMPVRALCRQGTSLEPLAGLDVEVVEGDLSDPDLLVKAASGCQAVIHAAAMIHIGWSRFAASREVNVEGTRRVIQACTETGARLIYVSTVDTLPAALDSEHPIAEDGLHGIEKTACAYVVSKTEAEALVREQLEGDSRLDGVIIHPGFMLGPFDWKPSSGRMMLAVHQAPIVAAPRGGCSFCDARDVAVAIVNAIELGQRGENYILGGENWTYQRLWREMLQVTGRRRRVFRMGPGIKVVGAAIDLATRWLPLGEGDVNGAAISMGSLFHYYDSSKAARELNYARRSPTVTLTDAWQWLSGQR